MKRKSKIVARVVVGGLAALAFVLSASRVATSTTFVYRTVSAAACVAATNESPDIFVVPGWSCGLQAGSDNNGAPISGQLSSLYFDYYVFNTTPNIQLCAVKNSFSGATYSDCIRPGLPVGLPSYADTYLQPVNVKQNPNLYDYVYAAFIITNDPTHPDYKPRDVFPLGVAFITGY